MAEGKRIIEEMKANEQRFRDAFVAEMQKEFDEARAVSGLGARRRQHSSSAAGRYSKRG